MKKNVGEEQIVKLIGNVIRALLIVTIFAQVIYTIYHMTRTFSRGFEVFIDSTIIDTLLILVLLEIYMAVSDYVRDKGRTVAYVIDATISYLLREIIIQALSPQGLTMTLMLAYSGGVLALAASRFLISKVTRE